MNRSRYTKVARKRKPNRWHALPPHVRSFLWVITYNRAWLPPRRKRTGLLTFAQIREWNKLMAADMAGGGSQ